MKIAFVGDSFCAETDDQHLMPTEQQNIRDGIKPGFKDVITPDDLPFSYLDIVSQHLTRVSGQNAGICCQGLVGRALYHSYKVIVDIVDDVEGGVPGETQFIDDVDYVIFCITDPQRLPNKYGISISPHFAAQLITHELESAYVLDDDGHRCYGIGLAHGQLPEEWEYLSQAKLRQRIKDLAILINGYYNDLISFHWHEVAQKGLIMQIDELMIQKQKKCIWFPCFDHSMQGYIPKSGPVADVALFKYAQLANDARTRNHFNKVDNRNMAKLITDIIDSNNFNSREIKMEDYFEVLK